MSTQQLCDQCGLPRTSPTPLATMFEEDFERCFICQKPSKGLYCSADCRQRDQGAFSHQAAPAGGPVKITSQLPAALSPIVRPTNAIGLSPRSSGQHRSASNGTSSSGSSSVTSSPLQSPRTNPSEADSPQKGTFHLPPPAYPSKQMSIPSSIPMKIPALGPKASPTISALGTPGSHGTTVYPGAGGASIDTLRFGRKPSAVNSVTSPNALIPRCACGLPANHRGRATSKDRADLADSGFSRLSLGAAGTAREEPISRSLRIVSDSAIPPFPSSFGKAPVNGVSIHHAPQQGSQQTTPLLIARGELPAITTTPGSLLSRSRSDPIPPSPVAQTAGRSYIAPAPMVATNSLANNITPSYRASPAEPIASASRPTRRSPAASGAEDALDAANVGSPRRGRSKEKQEHYVPLVVSGGILNHPAEREPAPSRSRTRGRKESARRSGGERSREREGGRNRERERERVWDNEREREQNGQSGQRSPRSPRSPLSPNTTIIDSPQILPSWSRPASAAVEASGRRSGEPGAGGVAPAMRRARSGGEKRVGGYARDEEEEARKEEELKRAKEQLGQVFGIAAG
ncbi:hypothetical protein IAT38_001211 [Cryptococcus sp. DSM 104549]